MPVLVFRRTRAELGRIDVIIPDDLESGLRVKVAQEYGGEKGALGKAVAEAIRLWLKQKESSTKKKQP
jgi:hypothetical protein